MKPVVNLHARQPRSTAATRPRSSSAQRWGLATLVAAALFGLTLAVYWPVTANEFINFDDGTYVYNNRHVRSGLSAANVRWALNSIEAANWHPLTWISLELDASLCGRPLAGEHADNPSSDAPLARQCHLTNIFLHAANTALLFFALWSITGAVACSAVVAALFGLHPLHVESVAWAAERKDVLSTFFWMLTLLAYGWYARRPALGRYALVVAAFAAGLAAKPMLVTLPCVLLLLDYWPLARLWPTAVTTEKKVPAAGKAKPEQQPAALSFSGALLEKAPLLILSAIVCSVTWHAQGKSPAVRSLEEFPLVVRVGNAAVTYCLYIGKMFWPQALAVFYPLQRQALPAVEVAVAMLSLAAVSVLVAYWAKRFPYLPVGWCWYLGTLVPVIGLVQVGIQARADRYTYVPLIGLFIMLVWGGAELARRWRCAPAALALAGVWLIALAWLTQVQIGYWKSNLTIWKHALAVTVDNSVAHTNLGGVYAEMGKPAQAEEQFRAALHVNPQDTLALTDMAALAGHMGNSQEALRFSEQALAIDPYDAKVQSIMAGALLSVGDISAAIEHFETAAALDPGKADIQFRLGRALSRVHRWSDAVGPLETAVQLAPASSKMQTEYRVALALALHQSGQAAAAARLYQEARELSPDWALQTGQLAFQLATLADADARAKNAPRALELALQVTQATGESEPLFLATLAAAYAANGDFAHATDAAVRAHDLAVRLGRPDLVAQTERQLESYRRNELFFPNAPKR